mgnify:CR=1 FL=1
MFIRRISAAFVLAIVLCTFGALSPARAACAPTFGGQNSTTELLQEICNALATLNASSVSSCAAAPVVSASAEATHVLKASAGSLCGVYAVNLTASPGFLAVVNAASAPADGAIAPLACAPLPANGVASIDYGLGATATFSTGITAVVTSAATCFTKTTGVITAFISGKVLP